MMFVRRIKDVEGIEKMMWMATAERIETVNGELSLRYIHKEGR